MHAPGANKLGLPHKLVANSGSKMTRAKDPHEISLRRGFTIDEKKRKTPFDLELNSSSLLES